MIKSCANKSCKSEFQDAQYGKNQRVHNESTKGATCTVCGTGKLGKK